MKKVRTANAKLVNLVLALVYCILYDYIFGQFVHPMFGYMIAGPYVQLTFTKYIVYLFLSVTPVFFFRGVVNIASLFSFFLYVLAYVPFIDTLIASSYPQSLVVSYCLVFYISMCLFFRTDRVILLKDFFNSPKRQFPIKVVETLTIVFLLLEIALNRGHMTFVNFLYDSGLMYEKRADNVISGIYFLGWLKNALVPLLMIVYLERKDYLRYVLCIVAFILMYMIDMQKATFVMPFVMTIAFFLIKHYPDIKQYFHKVVLGILIVISLILLGTAELSPELGTISKMFFFRTICIEGAELSLYLDFFEITHHPYTYFSHINFINMITHANPYPESIGIAVTEGGANANGVFWLMDGIAGGGIACCIIIGLLFIAFKSIMNSIELKCDLSYCIILLLPAVNMVINASLFTSIVTGGLFFTYLVFMFTDTKELKIV